VPKNEKHTRNSKHLILNDISGDKNLSQRILDAISRGMNIFDSNGECIYTNPAYVNHLGVEDGIEFKGKNIRGLAEFARFTEMIPGPALQVDPEGKVLLSNATARDLFGSNLQSCHWLEIFPDMDQKTWKSILSAQSPISIEQKIGNKLFIFSHRPDSQSGLVFVFGADITEKKKTDKTWQQTDDLVRLVLNSTMEGIYGIDLDGKCTFANASCVTLLGFDSADELYGNQMHNLAHRAGPNGQIRKFEESRIYKALVRQEGVYVNDEVMFRKDNSNFPVEYWSHPVIQEGELIGCVVTFMDATKRRQIEELQSDYTSALAEIARFPEMNPGPVLRLDITGKVLMANKAAHNVFEKPVNHFWKDICPDIDNKIWKKIIKTKTVVLERHIGNHDYIFTHRRDFEGNAVFIFGADITEQKKVEWALQQTEKLASLGKLSAGLAHELNNPTAAAGRAGDQLKKTLDALQSAVIELINCNVDQEVWILLSDRIKKVLQLSTQEYKLSPLEICDREEELMDWLEKHDVQNSWEIASIMVKFYVKQKDLDDISTILSPDVLKVAMNWLYCVLTAYELTGNIVNSTHNISNLVNVVKSYSHMGSAPKKYVDIHTGIDDTINILKHKSKNGVEIIRQYDRYLPKIQIQGSELNQVWTNIVENAISAIDGTGKVIIKTFRQKNWLVVEIKDTGPGIPKDIQSKIFDPFFTTKQPGEGTGMGLNISHNIIVNMHKGRLSVNSVPGETCFEIKLPLRK
jgi:PAS domain S-box-containing protein